MKMNRLNTYVCDKCNGMIVTDHSDVGVTPFMLKCRANHKCNGIMRSWFGRHIEGAVPTHEWYRRENTEAMKPEELDHHIKGGAFLRELKDTSPIGRISQNALARILNLRRNDAISGKKPDRNDDRT